MYVICQNVCFTRMNHTHELVTNVKTSLTHETSQGHITSRKWNKWQFVISLHKEQSYHYC